MSSTQRAAPKESLLIDRYFSVRNLSETLCTPLETEDYVIQTMPDVSPPKWHLAHTSWFFETFLLKPFINNYKPVNDHYSYLFNSYYQGIGPQFTRSHRGLLSRPTVKDVFFYRQHVDHWMEQLLGCNASDEVTRRVILGLHHEQQHQELMLTDIKYNFGSNPLRPTYLSSSITLSTPDPLPIANQWVSFKGGLFKQGIHQPSLTNDEFVFDNETPMHQVFISPFAFSKQLVTNEQYLEFIDDGGYQKPELWLDDGWRWVNAQTQKYPLYWLKSNNEWKEFTLHGTQPVDLNVPVSHISFYEADAFARWANARLPSEFEWELVAHQSSLQGQFYHKQYVHPAAVNSDLLYHDSSETTFSLTNNNSIEQLFGYLWEWTNSDYAPYPGYIASKDAIGEYNGKFMCNQKVLRGGSCATSSSHIRKTYRNFFYPSSQWQFTGIRLAKSL